MVLQARRISAHAPHTKMVISVLRKVVSSGGVQIETEYQADLQRTCHMEMVHEEERQRRHKRRHRGQPAPPRELPACDKMYAFRNRQAQPNARGKLSNRAKRPPEHIMQHLSLIHI